MRMMKPHILNTNSSAAEEIMAVATAWETYNAAEIEARKMYNTAMAVAYAAYQMAMKQAFKSEADIEGVDI